MPTPCQSLCSAILDDDRARVKALLKIDPGLARRDTTEESCEASIAHWIYVGDSPLHVAAAGYRVEMARMLLAAGAEVGAAGNRRCSQPLHYASDGHLDSPSWNPSRQVAMIRLLLEAGANVDAQDKNGATPLHRAVRTRCAAAVQCLLSVGGDPAIRNKPGSTPFHLAAQNTGRGGSGAEQAQRRSGRFSKCSWSEGSARPSRTPKGHPSSNGPGASGFTKCWPAGLFNPACRA